MAAEVFDRKITEVKMVMNQQSLLIGYKTTSSFVNELSNNIKIIKICDGDKLTNCFSDKFYWGSENTEINTTELADSSSLGKDDYGTEVVGVMFVNGVNAIMTYNKNCKTQDTYSNQINTQAVWV